MKKNILLNAFQILIILGLGACTENPFGLSSSSSCDHAPAAQVGLPSNCQVSLAEIDNLVLWYDSNDLNTLVREGENINSLLDKSGSGNSLVYMTGAKSNLSLQSTNSRNSILFDQASGSYERLTNFNSSLSGMSDMSFFAVFRLKNFSSNSLLITNNANFEFRIDGAGQMQYDFGSGNPEVFSLGSILGDLIKISVTYEANTGNTNFYLNGNRVNQSNFAATDLAWSQFSIIAGSGTELMEIILYSDLKTSELKSGVENYLNSKWGFD